MARKKAHTPKTEFRVSAFDGDFATRKNVLSACGVHGLDAKHPDAETAIRVAEWFAGKYPPLNENIRDGMTPFIRVEEKWTRTGDHFVIAKWDCERDENGSLRWVRKK